MGYCVLHIEKGTTGKARGLGRHIDRLIHVPNADPTLTKKNLHLFFDPKDNSIYKTAGNSALSLQERIDNRLKAGYKGEKAIRKDAVTHLNIVLTGSHEEMTEVGKSEKKLNQWLIDNFRFVGQRFGFHNIVEFALHMDERTPHVHCVVVPLTKDGRLSAKEMMGNREQLTQLQTDYGKIMDERYGLQRGVKGSKATHDSVKEWYARVNQCAPSNVVRTITTPQEFFIPPRIDTPPLMGREAWAEKQNKRISEVFGRGVEDVCSQVDKNVTEELKSLRVRNTQLMEQAQRLRKRNAQLNGMVQERKKTKEKSMEKSRTRSL